LPSRHRRRGDRLNLSQCDIEGGEVTLWVISVDFDSSALCPLHPQLRPSELT
jgi:hypothetical protein